MVCLNRTPRRRPRVARDLLTEFRVRRVLLTTFSDTLASALRTMLKWLLSNEPRLGERIDVYWLNAIGLRLYKAHIGAATIAERQIINDLIREAGDAVVGHKFRASFPAQRMEAGGQRLAVVRLGSLPGCYPPREENPAVRAAAQSVVVDLRARWCPYARAPLITYAELFTSLAAAISKSGKVIFDFAVVDEAQDVSVAHIRFLAALGNGRPNALFFAGDLGQRIFQQPFSWKYLGVDVRGRSRTLRVNYRTSHQIRTQQTAGSAPR